MENCSFCGKAVCEDPAICEQAAEYEARLVAASVPTIIIPVTEYEGLKKYKEYLDGALWQFVPLEEFLRGAIKEQEG